jgi:hypothetical protein
MDIHQEKLCSRKVPVSGSYRDYRLYLIVIIIIVCQDSPSFCLDQVSISSKEAMQGARWRNTTVLDILGDFVLSLEHFGAMDGRNQTSMNSLQWLD